MLEKQNECLNVLVEMRETSEKNDQNLKVSPANPSILL